MMFSRNILLNIFIHISLLNFVSSISPLGRHDQDVISVKNSDPGFRLPDFIVPEEYEITLNPNFISSTFDGIVKISFKCKTTNISQVTMHAKSLNDLTVIESSENITKISYNGMYDFVIFDFENNLPLEKTMIIKMNYTGVIQNDMTGFYRSTYKEGDVTKYLGTTQLQPVHARKVFPCFDEPGYKSKFILSLNCPSGFNCISNMPAENRTPISGTENFLVKFYETPKMSTYLLAFIISEFVAANQTSTTDSDKFSIIARPEASEMGEYGFHTGRKIVQQFNTYMGINYYDMYPNLKMDQVAIPDFSAGAMENWGLITYREPYILYHPEESSTRYRQQVIRLLAHEIAHMWFGNYVTCRWWSDTWLNEGFANFFQHYISQKVEDFGFDDQFLTSQVQSSLLVDTSLFSTPMSNPNVNSPDEISNQFGTITYSKGASIIRMMENIIGVENFKTGLNEHLKQRAFMEVSPDDLFNRLNEASNLSAEYGLTVGEIMGSWTTQAGFPLLHVNVDRTTGKIKLTQKRFLKLGESENNIYNIPIAYTWKENANFINTKPLLVMNTSELFLENESAKDWVIFNTQQMSFYRVNYDSQSWEFIIDALKTNVIHKYNKGQIVDDVFNLARGDHMNYGQMFDIIQFLENEVQFNPWTSAISGFSFMRVHFGKINSLSDKLNNHILNLVTNLIKNLGFSESTSDSNLRKIFRTNVLSLACSLGYQECIDTSKTLFATLKNSSISVNPNLRETVYCNGIRHGDKSDFDYLWNKFESSNVEGEKVIILSALGCAKKSEIIQEYLSKILSNSSIIRNQDKISAYNSALTGNPENAITIFEFLQTNVAAVRNAVGYSSLGTMISNLLTRFGSDELTRFERWIETSTELSLEEHIYVSLYISRSKKDIAWALSRSKEVSDWLDEKYKSTASVNSPFSVFLIVAMMIVLKIVYWV